MTKVLIVTGASRGIGAATARMAGARGYDVAVNYMRDDAGAAAVVGDIKAAGRRAVAVQGDMGSDDDVARLFETVDRELGVLSGLVNNAGIIQPASRLDDMDMADLRRLLEVNVVGCFLCARAAVRRMSTAHGGAGGAIVNVSSRAAGLGSPNEFIGYAASKGAVDSLSIGLSKEVAAEGIRVNIVSPGLIETEIHAAAGIPERLAKLAPGNPMPRAGMPEEVAEAILWLLSDAASYVTGANIFVSGGR